MGLFQHKQASAVADDMPVVFDDAYLDNLRKHGREVFEAAMGEHAAAVKDQLEATIGDLAAELKTRMTKQLDAAAAHVNSELAKHLQERLGEYDRMTQDAQDLAVQSLNRNAQALHNNYQQLTTTLQQTIATQEAMMIGLFEEHKAQMKATQEAQDTMLQSLSDSAQSAHTKTDELTSKLEQTVSDQSNKLHEIYDENMARVSETKEAQATALNSLTESLKALEDQHQKITDMLQNSVAKQEAMLIEAFEGNMARIVEHYVREALGDQFDVASQLPAILKQLEANKQAMKDDMLL